MMLLTFLLTSKNSKLRDTCINECLDLTLSCPSHPIIHMSDLKSVIPICDQRPDKSSLNYLICFLKE